MDASIVSYALFFLLFGPLIRSQTPTISGTCLIIEVRRFFTGVAGGRMPSVAASTTIDPPDLDLAR